MKVTNDGYNVLLKWAGRCLKYFLLLLLGLSMVCLLAIAFGGEGLAAIFLNAFGHILWRLAIALFCLLGTAIIVESWR